MGVTNDLLRRAFEHRTHAVAGFSNKYNTTKLVYFEMFDSIEFAISREKALKKWRRAWKVNLIENENPNWVDLFDSIGP